MRRLRLWTLALLGTSNVGQASGDHVDFEARSLLTSKHHQHHQHDLFENISLSGLTRETLA